MNKNVVLPRKEYDSLLKEVETLKQELALLHLRH